MAQESATAAADPPLASSVASDRGAGEASTEPEASLEAAARNSSSSESAAPETSNQLPGGARTNAAASSGGWNLFPAGAAKASFTLLEGGGSVEVSEPGEKPFDILLRRDGLKIEKDKWYRVEFEVRADRSRSVNFNLSMAHPPWHGLGFVDELDVSTKWQRYRGEFRSTSADDNAGLFFPIGASRSGIAIRGFLMEEKEVDQRADQWQLTQGRHSRARLEYPLDDPMAVRVEIEKKGRVTWNVQLSHEDLPVYFYRTYVLKFRARADEPRQVGVSVTQSSAPFGDLGLFKTLDLTEEWEDFRFQFTSSGKDPHARINFSVGDSFIPVEVAEVRLEPLDAKAEAKANAPPPPRPGGWYTLTIIGGVWGVIACVAVWQRQRIRQWIADQEAAAARRKARGAGSARRGRRRHEGYSEP